MVLPIEKHQQGTEKGSESNNIVAASCGKRRWGTFLSNRSLTPPPDHGDDVHRVTPDADANNDASKYTIEQLLEMKGTGKSSKNVQFGSLTFTSCDLDVIDALFPKGEKYGQLDPPPCCRVSAASLREWRRLGKRQQEQKIQENSQQSSSEPAKRQCGDRRSRSSGCTPVSSRDLLPSFDGNRPTATSLPSPRPLRPTLCSSSCQGLTLDFLCVDKRTDEEGKRLLVDAGSIECSFIQLVEDALQNATDAVRPTKEWPLNPSCGQLGALYHKLSGDVLYILQLRNDSERFSSRHEKYGFVSVNCCWSLGTSTEPVCQACQESARSFIRMCRKLMKVDAETQEPCPGLTLDILHQSQRHDSVFPDNQEIERGFYHLVGTAGHNRFSAVSQRQPWDGQTLGLEGALFHSKDMTQATFILRKHREGHTESYSFIVPGCSRYVSTDGDGASHVCCDPCLAAKPALLRKCRQTVESRASTNVIGKRLDHMKSPTEYKHHIYHLNQHNQRKADLLISLKQKLKDVISNEPERELAPQLCADLNIEHPADLFGSKKIKHLMDTLLCNETTTRRKLGNFIWAECQAQAETAQRSGNKACRYSTVMMKFAIAMYAKLGPGRYDFVAQAFNMPKSRAVQKKIAGGSNDEDGLCYDNIIRLGRDILERYGHLPTNHPLRLFSLSEDACVIKDSLVMDYHNNSVVGIATDDSTLFDPIQALLKALETKVDEEEAGGDDNGDDDTAKDKAKDESLAKAAKNAVGSSLVKAKHYQIFLLESIAKGEKKLKTTAARYGLASVKANFLKDQFQLLLNFTFRNLITVVVLGFDGATENQTSLTALASLTVKDLVDRDVFPKEWLAEPNIPKDLKLAFEHPRSTPSCPILVFLHGDMPHAIKKFVNALERSSLNNHATNLRFRGQSLSLGMLHHCWVKSQVDGAARNSKLGTGNFEKNASSRMRVHLSVQITSKGMVRLIDHVCCNDEAQKELFKPIREILLNLDSVVDVVNVRNEFKDGISSSSCPALDVVLETVKIFTEWKQETAEASHFVPNSTYQDLCWMCLSLWGLACYYIKPIPAESLQRAKYKYADVAKPLILNCTSLGEDNCEHRFANLNGRNALTKQAADHAMNKAAVMGATQCFNMKSKANTSQAEVKTADLKQELPKPVKRAKKYGKEDSDDDDLDDEP